MSVAQQDIKAPSFQETVVRVLQIGRRTLNYWPALAIALSLAVGAFFLAPKLFPPGYMSWSVLAYREVIQQEALLGNNLMPAESRRTRNSRLRDMLMARSTLQPIMEAHGLFRRDLGEGAITDALDEFKKAIDCRISDGDVFTVTYRGRSRSEAYKVTSDLSQSLVNMAKEYGFQQAEATQAFLQAQVDTAAKDLARLEQRVAEFLTRHPEFAVLNAGQTGGAGLVPGWATARASEQTATQLASSAVLRRRAALLNHRIAEASQRPPPPPVVLAPRQASAEATAALRAAEQEVSQAQQALAARRARFTDLHPDVEAARRLVDAALGKLRTARFRVQEEEQAAEDALVKPLAQPEADVTNSLREELKQVEANLAAATKKRSDPEVYGEGVIAAPADESPIVTLEATWTSINRELQITRERSEQLERQLFRVSMVTKVQNSGGGSQLVVVERAFEPSRPFRRGPKRVGAVGFLVVFLIGVGVTVGLALLDDRLYFETDLARARIAPLVHGVPPLTLREG